MIATGTCHRHKSVAFWHHFRLLEREAGSVGTRQGAPIGLVFRIRAGREAERYPEGGAVFRGCRRTAAIVDRGGILAVRRSIRPSPVVSRPWSALLPRGEVGTAPVAPSRPPEPRLAAELRGRSLLAIDLVGIVIAAYIALALRFDRLSGPFLVPAFPEVVGLLLAVRTIVNIELGLYSRRWRFASVPDLERIVAAVALGSLIAIAIFYGASAVAGTAWAERVPAIVLAGRVAPERRHPRRRPLRDPGSLRPGEGSE